MTALMWTTTMVLQLLTEAAEQGIRVGKENTDGDYTAEGIAFHVWDNARTNGEVPNE